MKIMEEDVHTPKRSRMGNGSSDGGGANAGSGAAAQVAPQGGQRQDEDGEDGEGGSLLLARGGGALAGARGLRPWHQHSSTASRIYRVSRASGGKDRHSKVMTAKGLRDRRVRLSVSTAIQFYDLQDRLGYDQPSKAIEWLIKSAAEAIADLPSLDGAFPVQAVPPSCRDVEEKPAEGTAEEEEADADVSQVRYDGHHDQQYYQQEEEEEEEDQPQHQPQRQQQRLSLTKSTCSSTSETSKGSVLSLSRSEIRVKARERARERTASTAAKDKDDTEDDAHIPSAAHHQSMNPNPTSPGSFTELLTGGGGHQNRAHNNGPVSVAQANPATAFIHKQLRHLPTSAPAATAADYFGQVGLLGAAAQRPHLPTMFPTQAHFASSSPMGMVPFNVAAAAAASSAGDHPELQQHYMQEHPIPFAVTSAGGDYINFSIASGFNRGTLQSNSPTPALHHHLQMFPSPVDASNLPFFLGAGAASASGEDQLPAGLDSRLQLCYSRRPDLKGKGKN